MNSIRTAALTVMTFSIALGSDLAGQDAPRGRAGDCVQVPSLGIASWHIRSGNIRTDADGRVWYEFRTEPAVGRVRLQGPAAGRLARGDVLVSIDGSLITTSAAWRRLESVKAGEWVELRVRRDGEERDIRIRADEECLRTPPAPPAPPRARSGRAPSAPPLPPVPRLPNVGVAAIAPVPPALGQDRGFLGVSFRCGGCAMRMVEPPGDGDDAPPRLTWEFSEPPVLSMVSRDGPAWLAGLRVEDRILAVDGARITAPEGWERFSNIEPGKAIDITFERDGRSRTVSVTPTDSPPAPLESYSAARLAPTPRPSPEALRAAHRAYSRAADAYVRAQESAAQLAARASYAQAAEAYYSALGSASGIATATSDSPLRYTGVIGDVGVEVRGAPANTSYDAETGELIILSAGSWIRLKLTEKGS
ncbi:MAG: PDZ domain-containing protein [Gemmatimonadota bacterium]